MFIQKQRPLEQGTKNRMFIQKQRPPDHNVILTPYIGSYALEARIRMEEMAVENLIEGLKRQKSEVRSQDAEGRREHSRVVRQD